MVLLNIVWLKLALNGLCLTHKEKAQESERKRSSYWKQKVLKSKLSAMHNSVPSDLSQLDNSSHNITSSDHYHDSAFMISMMAVLFLVTIVGLVGNAITIGVVKFREIFHNATFTLVALLAFVDFFALFLRGFVVICTLLEIDVENMYMNAIFIGTYTTSVCSCGHVVLLARLRYKLLAYPIKGLTISPRNMLNQSVFTWVVSIASGIPYGFHVYLNLNLLYQGIVEVIVITFVCIITVIPIVTFHVLKVRKMKQNITSRNQTISGMNKMIVGVCIVQIVSITPMVLGTVLYYFTHYSSIYTFVVGQLLVILNHAINPILFFYFSCCRRIFRKRTNGRNDSTRSSDTRI